MSPAPLPRWIDPIVPGIDLRALLSASGPWTVADACEAMRQTAVGLARLRRADAEASQLTGSDAGLGTYDFIAPEQIRHASAVDIRADLYRVGCTLYALLAGHPPFRDRVVYEKLFAHCHDPVPPLSEIRPDVPETLLGILNSLLAKSPADRFETPALLVEALTPLCQAHRLSELAARHVAADAPADIDETKESRSTSVNYDTDRKIGGSQAGIGATSESTGARRHAWLPWTLAVTASMLLALAGGIYGPELALRWLPRQEPRLPSLPSPTPEDLLLQPPNLNVAPLNRWMRLLEFEPREVFWPQDGLSQWFYDSQQEQVTFATSHVGLLELGEVQQESFLVQIGLHQLGWSGGVGVFFGLHDAYVKGEPCLVFQYLVIRCERIDGLRREFRLERGVMRVFATDQSGRRFDSSQFMSESIPEPVGEQQIELHVEASRLRKVAINGQAIAGLLNVPSYYLSDTEEHRGKFGVYAVESSASISDARFKRLGEPRGTVSAEPPTDQEVR